jgi:uncharacterized protein YdiU (UPF0061 family)
MKIKDLKLNNTFTAELPADEKLTNAPRQVYKAMYSFVTPRMPSSPKLIIAAEEMAKTLEIEDVDGDDFLNIVTGREPLPNSAPYAMNYGGHQFGHWAGQLGDGRAINLAQVEVKNVSWTLQLKGAGATPYSRSADGLAVLRSSIREFLCSEAMHHLGIPTTRALSLSLTGDQVLRDMLYNGNPRYEPGAIVCRVAPSFIRFGSFELLSARQDIENLKKITDYTINYYYPNLGKPSKESYLAFYREVALKTADMIIDWQRVGFVHGVMNTDNLSILGQTIDYGPYGWVENFDPEWTPNTTDREHRRYRFGNQGSIALWNLTQLANALYPLIEDVPALEQILDEYRAYYIKNYYRMQLLKLGLEEIQKEEETFVKDLFDLLTITETDMTIFYRNLAAFDADKQSEMVHVLRKASYCSDEVFSENKMKWNSWLEAYATRLNLEGKNQEERVVNMNKINPKFVLRNYMAQLAIEEAENGKYELIHEFYKLLKNPYDEQKDNEKWFALRPNWALDKVGCSQLSCSS